MPFVLPRGSYPSERVALVLAFGRLSALEACEVLGGGLERLEVPHERVAVASGGRPLLGPATKLAGAHKVAPLIEVVGPGDPSPTGVVEALAAAFDELPPVAVSAYGVEGDDYEGLVRGLLDGLRDAGFRKTRLLRPDQNELRADDVLSRRAVDVVAFPYGGGIGLGLTAWVPDSRPVRERGVGKPAPRSEISMSPRLASTLLNLAGLSPGATVLDPFCGSGTVLAEALLRSCRALGVDSSEARVREARRNLSWAATGIRGASFHLRVGDARELGAILGDTKVDAVVTEPLLIPSLVARPQPGTAAALLENAGGVYAAALASAADVLAPGGRVVMVVPVVPTMDGSEAVMELEGRSLGLRLREPGPLRFDYPVRLSFESTRWVRRAVYSFESPA